MCFKNKKNYSYNSTRNYKQLKTWPKDGGCGVKSEERERKLIKFKEMQYFAVQMKNLEDQEWGEGTSSKPYAPKAQKERLSALPVTRASVVLTGQIHGPVEVTGEIHNAAQEPHTFGDPSAPKT